MSILVATDFSTESKPALRKAASLAVARKVPLRVLHCVESAVEGPPWGHMLEIPPDMEERLQQTGRDHLEEFLGEALEDSAPENVEYRVRLRHAAEGILAEAAEQDVDFVVVGATGRSRFAEALLGSTAEEIVRASEPPVLVVPGDGASESFETVVAPVDLSDCSRASLRLGAEMARLYDAPLHIVHVYASPSSDSNVFSSMFGAERAEDLKEQRRERFAEFVGEVDLRGVEFETTFETGVPHRSIVEHVDDSAADLVVMGTHGRRGLDRLVLGSTASKVLRHMPCSVLTVRAGDGGGE